LLLHIPLGGSNFRGGYDDADASHIDAPNSKLQKLANDAFDDDLSQF
jgi:hypothetical protein